MSDPIIKYTGTASFACTDCGQSVEFGIIDEPVEVAQDIMVVDHNCRCNRCEYKRAKAQAKHDHQCEPPSDY